MSLHVRQSTSFTPAPEGVHPARLVWTIDIGQQETQYGDRDQVILSYELVNEQISEDKNFLLSRFYGATIAKNSNLREVIVSLTGKEPVEMDLKQLLGLPCLVTVTHQYKGESVYANIKGVTAIPKGMEVLEAKTPLLAYDLDDPNDEAYQRLPEWIKHRISYSKMRIPNGMTNGSPPPVAGSAPFDNDIPF